MRMMAVALSSLWLVGTALGCTCGVGKGKTMREAAEWQSSRPEMELIFEGKVTAQELRSGSLNSAVSPLSITMTGRFRVVHLTALHVYRGATNGDVVLRTGLGTGDCGYPFETESTYLVYASKMKDGNLVTSICHGTRRIEDAGADLRLLSGSPATSEDMMSPREYSKHYFEDILPKRTGSICGFVQHPDGAPLRGASVELYQLRADELPARSFADENTSGEDGHFCVQHADPGKYLLTVEHDDFDRDAREIAYYPGAHERSEAIPIEIRAGEKLPDVTIKTVRQRLFTVRIRVVTPDGTKLSYKNGAGVAIEAIERDPLSDQISHGLQEDGSYTFGYIPPGKYIVTTYFDETDDDSVEPSAEATRWKPARREVVVGGDTDVEIRMEPVR
jgi:hypothetical protein